MAITEAHRARNRRWTRAHPEVMRERNWRAHGIDLTYPQYLEMLEAQNGQCLGCGKEPQGRALHVDHDHETGRVRGLLCTPCNLADVLKEASRWEKRRARCPTS